MDNQTQGTDFASDSGQALVDAIAAAGPGDQLAVLETCPGNFRLDKSLTLTGVSQKRFPAPTLDGQQAGTTLTVGGGAAVTLTNLTITGGTADFGGGIYNNGGTLTLDSSTVSGNTAGGGGGGIFNNGDTRQSGELLHREREHPGQLRGPSWLLRGHWLPRRSRVSRARSG